MQVNRSTHQIMMAFATGLCALPALAATPDYPTKPIRLIVPFPPGGGTDLLARVIGEHLSGALNQNVVVDNRAGGNTVIGSEIAARPNPMAIRCSFRSTT